MISILDFILNAKGQHLMVTQFDPPYTRNAEERMNNRGLRIEALRQVEHYCGASGER